MLLVLLSLVLNSAETMCMAFLCQTDRAEKIGQEFNAGV